ncbi:MAG: hypothetical protein ABJA34_03345 [Pseudonocardiales bacterium]
MPDPQPGVIHDIGYRHYTGPRLGRAATVRALYVQSFRGAYGLGRSAKSKIMPILILVIMCLPALVIAAVVNGLGLKTQPVRYTRYAMLLLAVVSIFVAAQSPQMVSRDLRFRLTSLYFSRPLSRLDYVAAKYAAMVCALLVLLVSPLVILYGGGLLARLPAGAETRHFLIGVAGAVLFALVLAGIGLLIAAFTPRRGFGVAAVIAVLLVTYSAVSVVQGIALEQGQASVAGYAGLFSPFTLVDGVQVWLLHAQPSTPVAPPGTLGGVTFLAATVVVVAVSVALLLLRYRKVSIS